MTEILTDTDTVVAPATRELKYKFASAFYTKAKPERDTIKRSFTRKHRVCDRTFMRILEMTKAKPAIRHDYLETMCALLGIAQTDALN